jgi:site-specific recombinase XerD
MASLYLALAELEKKPSADRMPGKIIAWLKVSLPGLSASEQTETSRMADVVSKAFADFLAEQVQAKHVHEFLTTNFVIPGKLRTAQRYRNVLNRFFRWAIVQGIRSDNPVGKSRPIGATESRPNGASGRCGFSSFGRGCF